MPALLSSSCPVDIWSWSSEKDLPPSSPHPQYQRYCDAQRRASSCQLQMLHRTYSSLLPDSNGRLGGSLSPWGPSWRSSSAQQTQGPLAEPCSSPSHPSSHMEDKWAPVKIVRVKWAQASVSMNFEIKLYTPQLNLIPLNTQGFLFSSPLCFGAPQCSCCSMELRCAAVVHHHHLVSSLVSPLHSESLRLCTGWFRWSAVTVGLFKTPSP